MGGPIDVYVDPANPDKMAFGEEAKRLSTQTARDTSRGANLNLMKGEKKRKEQSAKGIKTLMSDLSLLEQGSKTLLGM